MSCWRSATLPATRSRSARARRVLRGQALLHRRPHRASAVDHRQGAVRPVAGHPMLGAADYKLAHHAANGRRVYSFCMCPGGTVVAAASEEGRLVTNGMSQYSRKERNANAGIVVGVAPEDFPGRCARQSARRHRLPAALGRRRSRPAARPGSRRASCVGDFLAERPSTALGASSRPTSPASRRLICRSACRSTPSTAMREALPVFGRQIRDTP